MYDYQEYEDDLREQLKRVMDESPSRNKDRKLTVLTKELIEVRHYNDRAAASPEQYRD